MTNTLVCQTTPFDGQKPGTSGTTQSALGLSKPRIEKESQGVYAKELHRELCSGTFKGRQTEIDGKAILEAIPEPGAKGATLVIGGDGRFYNKEVMQIIAKMAAANGVSAP